MVLTVPCFMDSEKKHIIFTAEDIQKYLAGKLTPAEMYAMEKAALDDLFLAEAMEGYTILKERDWDKELILLKDKFRESNPAKVIGFKRSTPYSMWKVAAAVFILCSGVAITYLFTNRESSGTRSLATINSSQDSINNTVAETSNNSTEIKVAAPAIATTEATTTERQSVAQTEQKALTDTSFIYRPGKTESKKSKQEAGGGYADDKFTAGNEYATSNAAPANQEKTLAQASTPGYNESSKVERAAANTDNTAVTPIRKFSAQVVGQDGSPLPFANISISGNTGTYSDAKGNFRLESSDSMLNIEIRSAGYISRYFTLRSDIPQNKIVLAEDELALKEITMVTGKKDKLTKKRMAVLQPDSVINAEPLDGWSNYDTYIDNNLSMSNDILQKKIHGEVAVAFEVEIDGTITNLKIVKSLCDDCDKAALRVIKEGPRWKVKYGKRTPAKVKVKF